MRRTQRMLSIELDAERGPRIVRLGPEALALFTAFEEKIEPDLARGGALGDQRQWGAKLCGGILRITLALHCLETFGKGTERSAASCLEVNGDTARAALSLVPYLIAHERIASGLAGNDPKSSIADRVLCWLERSGLEGFTRRECFTACRGELVQQVEDLDAGLELLQELGHIRLLPAAEPSRGRPRSPAFVVNPLWRRGVGP